MKTSVIIITIFFSVPVFAQPSVTGSTSPAKDTIIILPTNSITLTGTAVQSNPGHPILDTSWTQTSGPAATITNPSNHMTTTVTGMVAGTYVFTLTATDKNKSASATVKVTVLSGILPLELGYFYVTRNDKGILISWQTDLESHNAFFIIQQCTDGSHFDDMAIVPTQAKNGNSSRPLEYSYQISANGSQAGMYDMLFLMVMIASTTLISSLHRILKSMVLSIACVLFFSCTKSVTEPIKITSSSTIAFRLKQVNLDNQVNYSEVKIVN